MPAELKALYEKKGKAWKRCNDLNDKAIAEKRAMTAEEETEYKRNWDEVTQANDAIKRTKDLAKAGRRFSDRDDRDRRDDRDDRRNRRLPGRDDSDRRDSKRNRKPGGDRSKKVTEEHRCLATQAWCRSQLGLPLTTRHVEACRLTGLNPRRSCLSVALGETRDHRTLQDAASKVNAAHIVRAMSATNLATGGSFVPQSFVNTVEVNMLAFSSVEQFADVIRTDGGGEMPWPTVDDTSNEGAQVGENTTAPSGNDPATGKKVWRGYKFTSKPILVGQELLEDSAFNLVDILGQMIGERLGRAKNRKYTTGDGASSVEGFLTGGSVGKTCASATAITPEEIRDLIHSLDPAYRTDAAFQLHDQILCAISKFKDSQNRPLWQAGLADGVPDRIAGYRYGINQFMDSSIAASAKTMAFGNWKRYKIRQVREMRIYRLQERYRENDQDGFIGFVRVDGGVLNAGTNPIKILQQAAS